MATKKEWQDYLKERKKFEKAYAKETIKLEQKLSKIPDGEVVSFTGPGSFPTPPPPPPPGK